MGLLLTCIMQSMQSIVSHDRCYYVNLLFNMQCTTMTTCFLFLSIPLLFLAAVQRIRLITCNQLGPPYNCQWDPSRSLSIDLLQIRSQTRLVTFDLWLNDQILFGHSSFRRIVKYFSLNTYMKNKKSMFRLDGDGRRREGLENFLVFQRNLQSVVFQRNSRSVLIRIPKNMFDNLCKKETK